MDKTVNNNAPTGNFELIHQIAVSKFAPAESFSVEGAKKPILEPMQIPQKKSRPVRGSVRPATAIKAPVQNINSRAIQKSVTADLNKVKQTPQAKINQLGSRTKRVEKLLELHDMIGRLLHSA